MIIWIKKPRGKNNKPLFFFAIKTIILMKTKKLKRRKLKMRYFLVALFGLGILGTCITEACVRKKKIDIFEGQVEHMNELADDEISKDGKISRHTRRMIDRQLKRITNI